MGRAIHLLIGLAVLALVCAAEAQQPIVYPAKGQSPQQQSQDDAQCAAWAKQSTGIDPAVAAANPPPQQTGPAGGGGQRVRGAARGAAGGAAIGAITGDAGEGAGVGAVVGTMAGGRRARQQQAAQNQQAQAQQQERIQTYYRGYGACMEGRGYTIK
jgi:YMGG-like Gly-zipper